MFYCLKQKIICCVQLRYNVTLVALFSFSWYICVPLWLQNIRARTLQGIGFGLSFGRLPGSLCNKYMLVDGDKVMFGSYR